MEIEEIGVGAVLGARGLKNMGMIEVSQDPESGGFVLVISKGIRERWYRKWLRLNLPEAMWRVRCSREEVPQVVNSFLVERIVA
ncbi:MAG: hypothetical protein SV910_06950 [Chloroflexota bacterium]|nr:hypothetical protein [Chloroflexota bacterium]